jgi:histidinol-phosphate/aromatic aminotransferase/cobyric acid decarboxylase-like protein/GNAT superfamily N-acetyltransferase
MSHDGDRIARIATAKTGDRPEIYEMRHEVYARELGQHKTTPEHSLSDSLDAFNEYITAHIDGKLAGFISITPPCFDRYSIDKYVARDSLPFPFDDTLYELRILTVAKEHRRSRLAATLMYAAFRWVEERNGKRIVAMGRTEVLSIYLKHGLQLLNHHIKAGAVTFEMLTTTVKQLRGFADRHHRYYKKLHSAVIWDINFPFFKPACCFHGGAFFDAIGTSFDSLERRKSIVNADVLDAWFPPSPKVLDTLREHLPWLMSTSPPTASDGLRTVIARSRGVNEENILAGAGSSDLIYLAFRQWLDISSRVLILDPTYGEYAHILENVIGCKVQRLLLPRHNKYVLGLDELQAQTQMGYDLIVLVNPNNPTGQLISRSNLEKALIGVPGSTRVWVDEAYIDYTGPNESLERFASRSENIFVCKSMSKVYALSGMRAAYLCAPIDQLSELSSLTPPWAVSLPAQVAAVLALEDGIYYMERYRETRSLRAELVDGLRSIGIREIVPGTANFVMCHLEPEHPTAADVVAESRKGGVFLRDVCLMGSEIGSRALRIAVKNKETNAIIVETLEKILCARRVTRV